MLQFILNHFYLNNESFHLGSAVRLQPKLVMFARNDRRGVDAHIITLRRDVNEPPRVCGLERHLCKEICVFISKLRTIDLAKPAKAKVGLEYFEVGPHNPEMKL